MKSSKLYASVVLAFVLAGCSGGKSVTNSSDADTSSTPASASVTSSEAVEASSETSSDSPSEGSDSLTKKFGSTFTWDDKISVTVSEPKPFTPSDTAAGGEKFKKFVVVDVALKNGSDKPYSAMDLMITATSGDQQSDGVFDSAQDIDTPSADVLPGKTLRWKQAYGVDASGELTLKVENGFGNAAGYYTK